VLRAVVRLSLVVLVAGLTLVLTASPCGACSCVSRTPKELLRRADAAFVGSVVEQRSIDQTTTLQTFRVRSIFKGPLGPTVSVIDPIGSAGGDTCGILYGSGEVALILYRQGDGWTTDVCSRITTAQLAAVGPTPTHPGPEPSDVPSPVVPTVDGGGSGLGWPAVIVGLLVGVAAIAAALSLGAWRDRGRSPGPSPMAGPSTEPGSDPPEPSG
jgi:hypothetical protein